MKKLLCLIVILCWLVVPVPAYAHPGKTDKFGCHTDKKGFFHCHDDAPITKGKKGAKSQMGIDDDDYDDDITVGSREVLVGEITKIVDGDTLVLKETNGERKIRLYGIDAPEADQPYSEEATEALNFLIGKEVSGTEVDKPDRYGRTIAILEYEIRHSVYERERHNINKYMVENGHAWVYPQYCKDQPLCEEMEAAEAVAKSQGLGLWKDEGAVPPWEWRKSSNKGNK